MKYFNLIVSGLDKTFIINEITEKFYNNNSKKENTCFFVCYRLNEIDLNKFVNDLITIGNYKREY
jgi:hypothetical protein